MADAPRVFLSYSHDSAEHAARVLALADALCDLGINVILDRYVHPAPAEGWLRWMERNLDTAKFVLMVCTATYRRRVLGEEAPGQGTGLRWEGTLIYNRIAYGEPAGARFLPILLPGSELTHIPDPVRGYHRYQLVTFDLTDPGFEALYRHLTDQPATLKPDLGALVILPPKSRPLVSGLASDDPHDAVADEGELPDLQRLEDGGVLVLDEKRRVHRFSDHILNSSAPSLSEAIAQIPHWKRIHTLTESLFRDHLNFQQSLRFCEIALESGNPKNAYKYIFISVGYLHYFEEKVIIFCGKLNRLPKPVRETPLVIQLMEISIGCNYWVPRGFRTTVGSAYLLKYQ